MPALLSLFILAGCESVPKQQSGAVIGGIAGAAIGKQIGKGSGNTAATVAGTLIGAYIGARIGEELDRQDREQANEALETEPGDEGRTWKNPHTGNEYEVIPTQTYTTDKGTCRDFVTHAVIDGRKETIRGTACRQPDGTWRTVE
ncbi:MAG TPA: glycine zipper 2TM domain-containing protein [Chromatiales bacterium]|nr:glycine zipper 2TM domain-containing protein [Chromatiales bacterium]